mmetsp:Transcript_10837/g.21259  ORF Transcript_10837/g.21259 Transcript_10837/m.21259 type:complete len:248 (-) Transcript_10837:80-823(-)
MVGFRASFLVAVFSCMAVAMGSASGLEVPTLAKSESTNVKPLWPGEFSTTFVSKWKNTTGNYAVLVRGDHGVGERIVLDDGSRDHLCSTFHKNTPCTQLTTQGFRFLYFPEVKDCCKCCTYTQGTYECGGPLGPKWLNNVTGNMQYQGVESVNGRDCHKWTIIGLMPDHPNFYWQDVKTGLPCGMEGFNYLKTPEERADDQYLFDPNAFVLKAPPSLFYVPKICRNSRYCGKPVCATGPELFLQDTK